MKILSFALLLAFTYQFCFGQVFKIDFLPAKGVLLDKGWKWHTGDNPEWAKPGFDDSQWEGIDPTKDIFDLPQLDRQTGRINWFRLRLRLDSTLKQQIVLQIRQSGASEVYLNGRLIHRFGRIGKTPAETEAFTPNKSPVSFPASAGREQVLTVRYALQPGIRYGQHFGSNNPGLSVRLNRTEAATSAYREEMLKHRGGPMYVGSFGILAILFLTFFLFSPTRRETLYFAVFCLCLVFTWSTFYYLSLPIKVQNLFLWKNSILIVGGVGGLFLLLSVYTILGQKQGWIFWSLATLVIVAIYAGTYLYPWGWLIFSLGLTNMNNLDATRVALLATRRGQKGARIILVGGIVYMIAWPLISLQFSNNYTIGVDFFSISILSIPASYAIFYGYDFAMTNRSLQQKLTEVESLSAEKHQILATQNETLERQVHERTAELEEKNHDLEIEAALDKVRSRSLAMHSSDELQEVVVVVFEKLKELGLVFDGGAGIQLFTENSKDSILWVAAPGQIATPIRNNLPYDADDFVDNPIILDVWTAKETGEAIYNKTYTRDEKNRYFEYVFKHNDLIQIPQFVRDEIMQASSYTQAFVTEKNSGVIANSWSGQVFPPHKFAIFKRIAKVFDQAYTRFLDLQKAEAQAREAQIEVALERVRARAMAMQHSDELAEVMSVLCKGILNLGIHSEEMETCYITTFDEDKPIGEIYLTYSNGDLIPQSFQIGYDEDPLFKHIYTEWKRGSRFIVGHLDGNALIQHFDFLFSHVPTSIIEKRSAEPTQLPSETFTHALCFLQGYLTIVTRKSVPEYHEVFKRFGSTLQQAYTRFLDLQRSEAQAEQARLDLVLIQTEKKRAEDALTELRITQVQLIQKEKLASLGELTAGIAHEIQNPLNFVNNFSEVSTELVSEIRDEETKSDRDPELIGELLDDLTQNLQKITHHGSRASSIVKGMLEHSRTSTGERQLTNLNALTDEYLRLAYQGLRAKQKDFNCELITDFDPNLGLVEAVPQEIGRVLLNLFNNAFYAVRQRRSGVPADSKEAYKPTVWVSTKRAEQTVEIRVRDNGTGIPDAVKAKIFQPFFTTKPTGEGTGLGLSLSYDIVTKGHGGSLTVESVDGQGTEFIVKLPQVTDKPGQ